MPFGFGSSSTQPASHRRHTYKAIMAKKRALFHEDASNLAINEAVELYHLNKALEAWLEVEQHLEANSA